MNHRQWRIGGGPTAVAAIQLAAVVTLPITVIARIEDPESDPATYDNVLEEVIVTARRRPNSALAAYIRGVGQQDRNLTNKEYIVSGLDIMLGHENNFTAYYGNPRQYWLDVQYCLQ